MPSGVVTDISAKTSPLLKVTPSNSSSESNSLLSLSSDSECCVSAPSFVLFPHAARLPIKSTPTKLSIIFYTDKSFIEIAFLSLHAITECMHT